ncbi:MAG: hypothetical protein KDB23_30020, partial [Planctomycetales bacterium]|nr:hypothetical protein [Planctomycetales bacterium]
LTVSQGLTAMLDFYRSHRADDCSVDNDGDMLLYQWGMSRRGASEQFLFNMTRQFIIDGQAEDENIWQLSLTFRFASTHALQRLQAGNKWCSSPRPQAVDYFDRFVRESEPYRAIGNLTCVGAELEYFNAG